MYSITYLYSTLHSTGIRGKGLSLKNTELYLREYIPTYLNYIHVIGTKGSVLNKRGKVGSFVETRY